MVGEKDLKEGDRERRWGGGGGGGGGGGSREEIKGGGTGIKEFGKGRNKKCDRKKRRRPDIWNTRQT